MKNILYIDANIYLRFYDTNSPEFKKLIKSIEEVKNSIFFTQQIENEIIRNRAKVYVALFNNYIKQFALDKISLPEHLSNDVDGIRDLEAWNNQNKTVNDTIKKQKEELKKIVDKLFEDVIEGKDSVSKAISSISAGVPSYSASQIEKARIRKELGNPPGKPNDPLGDQLSWEQLLDAVKGAKNLWVITTDNDYFVSLKDKKYLNPLLIRDLKEKNSDLRIHCFDKLSEGFKSYQKVVKKIKTLPSNKELEGIVKEEESPFIALSTKTGTNEIVNESSSLGFNKFFDLALKYMDRAGEISKDKDALKIISTKAG